MVVWVLCGSGWVCPVCSANRWARERARMQGLLSEWSAGGGRVVRVVLTVPHGRGDSLESSLNVLEGAWRVLVSRRPWLRLVRGVGAVGSWRTLEVTDGEHGWHPHYSLLVFVPWWVSGEEVRKFEVGVRERWVSGVRAAGRDAGDGVVAVHARLLTRVEHGVAGYECKGPGEVVAALADRAAAGDQVAVARWREFQAAMRDRKAIRVSPGLPERVARVVRRVASAARAGVRRVARGMGKVTRVAGAVLRRQVRTGPAP